MQNLVTLGLPLTLTFVLLCGGKSLDLCSVKCGNKKVSLDRWLGKEGVVQACSGIPLSYKKRWNTATCANLDGWTLWCHAKWNKSDWKSREPCAFTRVWDVNLIATHEKTRQTNKDSQTAEWWLRKGTGVSGVVKCGVKHRVTEGDFTLVVNTQCSIRKMHIELYIRKLYDFINQCHPNKFNFKN